MARRKNQKPEAEQDSGEYIEPEMDQSPIVDMSPIGGEPEVSLAEMLQPEAEQDSGGPEHFGSSPASNDIANHPKFHKFDKQHGR